VSVSGDGNLTEVEAEVNEDLTIEVFSGLYVNEEEEVSSCSIPLEATS
jgi:hypothetical protein